LRRLRCDGQRRLCFKASAGWRAGLSGVCAHPYVGRVGRSAECRRYPCANSDEHDQARRQAIMIAIRRRCSASSACAQQLRRGQGRIPYQQIATPLPPPGSVIVGAARDSLTSGANQSRACAGDALGDCCRAKTPQCTTQCTNSGPLPTGWPSYRWLLPAPPRPRRPSAPRERRRAEHEDPRKGTDQSGDDVDRRRKARCANNEHHIRVRMASRQR
jgi:hypothetical protein